jgi:hypothetical protein
MALPAELAHQMASNKTPGTTNQNFSRIHKLFFVN